MARNLAKAACETAGEVVSNALNGVLSKVKTAGVRKPVLFFEAESQAIFVMDSEHPGYEAHGASKRQEAIVARIDLDTPTSFDSGAW